MLPMFLLFNYLMRCDSSENDQFFIGFPIGPYNCRVITDLSKQVYATRNMMMRMMAVLVRNLSPYSLFQGKYI